MCNGFHASCYISRKGQSFDGIWRWALTCFVGAWLNILESCALSQDTEFAVAVFAIKLFGLSIGYVLKKKKKNKLYFIVLPFTHKKTSHSNKQNMFQYLKEQVLRAGEAAHDEFTLLKHKVNSCSIVQVQVSQDVTVMVQHTGPECSTDACIALFTLGCAGCPSTECEICSYLTPADRTHTIQQSLIYTSEGEKN